MYMRKSANVRELPYKEFIKLYESDNRYAFKSILHQNFWPDISLWFSSAKLFTNDNGKISSELTLKNLPQNMKEAVRFLYKNTNRSKMFKTPLYKNARYSTLVPIFMAAHKEFNDVPYEDWDKDDKYLEVMLGKSLYEDIFFFLDDSLGILELLKDREILLDVREQAKFYNDEQKNLEKYANHSLYLKEPLFPCNYRWKPNNLVRHMMMQTWLAHPTYRNDFMILDIFNWDNIPEPFDQELPDLAKKDTNDDFLDF